MTETDTIRLLRAKIKNQARLIVDQARLIMDLKADLAERRQRIDQLESTVVRIQA